MPTSSQSKILSVVDHQLLQQSSSRTSLNQTPVPETKRRLSRDDHRPSTGRKDDDKKTSLSPPNLPLRRRSYTKINDSTTVSRASQRNDVLHIPIITINSNANLKSKTSGESSEYRRNSFNIDNQLKQLRVDTTPMGQNSSMSDLENFNDDNDDENERENKNTGRRSSLLDDNARRLLVLGTIRPSKSFYNNLSASDVEHLMEYFQRMRQTNQKISSEEINQELKIQSNEYKPKMFYDSTGVTKSLVNNIEKFVQQYEEKLRTNQAELVKLDDPVRFIIKSMDNNTTLATIPREYNDCLLTLISRTDPVHKSDLITALVPNKLLDDIKANSLDISYFPGGVNYDVPHDEIDDNGQMKTETYQKLKQRLKSRKIWYFTSPPEKKPHALVAILPSNISTHIDHQRLFDCLCDRLKTLSTDDIEQSILSIEFIPLSCILDSREISNIFIIDCDNNQTKQKLIDKPLKINLTKQLITIELQSYDEYMHREYHKSIKAEKYQQLIKNHDEAIKQISTK